LIRFLGLAIAGFLCGAGAQDLAPKAPIPDDKDPVTTSSGLKYSVLQPGEKDGSRPAVGDRVTVHYTGWLENGTEFDDSRRREKPAQFALGRVIPGWNEGLALMTRGMRCKLTLPPALGYGEQGTPGGPIPPNSTLIFDVELVDFEKAPAFVALQTDKLTTTESGVKYEIATAGTGDALTEKDNIEVHYGVWNSKGELLMSHCSEQGPVRVGIGDLQMPFMRELLLKLKEGGTCRAEVPVKEAFPRGVPPALGDDKACIWMLSVARVMRLPAYVASAPEKLTKTASGLQYEVLRAGTGKKPVATDAVQVHYIGWLEDGTVFDSSYGRGEPAEFSLQGVIRGWTEGVQLMQEGAMFQFVVPGDLAYGQAGSPPKIGPNATLVFRIELLKVR
jgi:FKBP-type peptidyl-prolyl cis-trans isomerase FklB